MFYWINFALFWLKVGLNFFSQLAIIQKENNTGLVGQVPSCSRLGQSGTLPERDSPRTPTLYPRLKFLTKIVKRRRGRHTESKSRTLKCWKWHYSTIFVYCAMNSDRTVAIWSAPWADWRWSPGWGIYHPIFIPSSGYLVVLVSLPLEFAGALFIWAYSCECRLSEAECFPVSCVSHSERSYSPLYWRTCIVFLTS